MPKCQYWNEAKEVHSLYNIENHSLTLHLHVQNRQVSNRLQVTADDIVIMDIKDIEENQLQVTILIIGNGLAVFPASIVRSAVEVSLSYSFIL